MRILVYGDSNSWGYLDDGLVQRYPDRWPVVMARHGKAAGWELIEECLSGRTTNLPDPEMGAYVDGSAPLLAILRSHQPFDLMLVMLGTNDLKTRFGRSADDIVGGLSVLSDIVVESEVWEGPVKGRLGFIAPPALGSRADDPNWDFSAECWVVDLNRLSCRRKFKPCVRREAICFLMETRVQRPRNSTRSIGMRAIITGWEKLSRIG